MTGANATSAGTPTTTTDDAPPWLRVQGVSVTFGALKALSDVSLSVEPGHIHAIIGPNGAGKSTLFNVISGLYRTTAGEVWLGDDELTSLRPHQITRLGLGRAFQNIVLPPHATVERSIMLGRHHLTSAGFVRTGLRLPSAVREQRLHAARVREIADFLELGDLFDAEVSGLSYGDRKRVEVGRALATEPRVLLLDEPVAGMNATESALMAEQLRSIRAGLGITILLVEHDMAMVMAIADRVTVLDFGTVIASGTPTEIQRDPEVIRAYLGSSDGISEAAPTATDLPRREQP
ncbi:branched-chain amino acid transport system ATP-binding protein [Parafrankia irregularis]|uniref:Branched-chain amino acid transport system ATP-binding protein n=1 Tax=Parafrankia irregularis TaxID=795642 RepID=A0A0S4QJM4_9ACTN|nr:MULTISPECIES: ABC transporter ATP-binding protein [Parafrankia]MBE3204088.1 ABC transporter ATP-binding protein [Parafrankia sp. CH37]CUU55036.1 branched-chain amino acid transport system ATP-binding protein [Parafrankia irregularis]